MDDFSPINGIEQANASSVSASTTAKPGQPFIDRRASPVVDEEEALELFFGLVGPTGVDLDLVCDSLKSELLSMDYDAAIISLSELITTFLDVDVKTFKDNHHRIRSLMSMGTFLKRETKQADIVARLAIAEIRRKRAIIKSNPNRKNGIAYIIRSFKLPAEVELLRELYAEQFTLISVYGSKESRIEFLKRNIGPTLTAGQSDVHELARQLIRRDYEEENSKNGQQVGKTFPLADYFVSSESRQKLESQLHRLVQLTFRHPYLSPTKDEQAMFFAQAAGLRSLDLSRQVGAAIIGDDGEVLSTGCNDVPKSGGGLYWGNDPNPQRDFELGYDANVVLKNHILEDVLHRLQKSNWLNVEHKDTPIGELLLQAMKTGTDQPAPNFRKSTLFDVIEFGRAVHAEMAAISQAARAGVRIQDSRLFCTTFPCHMCARHIVAAGVKEVIFIEPYEKSRVHDLYSDSVSIEPLKKPTDSISFTAFVGVSPRRYMSLFQSRGSKKSENGKALNSDGIQEYKSAKKKKTFHLAFLEAYIVNETEKAPHYKEENDQS